MKNIFRDRKQIAKTFPFVYVCAISGILLDKIDTSKIDKWAFLLILWIPVGLHYLAYFFGPKDEVPDSTDKPF